MRQIQTALFLFVFSNCTFAMQDVAANGRRCESLPNNEKDACYQFMHQCERLYLRPAQEDHAPGSNEDQRIDTAYDMAGFQVSQTDGITPNTEVAEQACAQQLPERDKSANALDGWAATCAKSKGGTGDKVSCNEFTVSYDRGGPQQGMCVYIRQDFSIINTKYTHEKTACAGVNRVDRSTTADAGKTDQQ